jgi:hypothetical protein
MRYLILVFLFFAGCGEVPKPPEEISGSFGDDRILTSEGRTALVIGNNNYKNFAKLKNAENDARDIAEALERYGFKVFKLFNGSRAEMNAEIENFSTHLKNRGGVGFIFYAGHGLEVGGKNYLVPVDVDMKNRFQVIENGVALNGILSRVQDAGNRLNIVVLDACRNNPFKDRSVTRDVFGEGDDGVGLALPPSVSGTYIAYSADVGQASQDGHGRNGTFTKHLLANLDRENASLNQILQYTRAGVEEATNGKQSPASYDKTTGDFYFKAPQGVPSPNPNPSPNPIGVYIWNGEESMTISNFKSEISKLSPQGEFERPEKFAERKRAFYEKVLNSWLGKQSIEMEYNPNSQIFSVSEKSLEIDFEIFVPFDRAKNFKSETRNFDFLFEEKNGELLLVGAKAGGFSTKLEIDGIEEKQKKKKAKAFLKYPREYSRNSNGVVSDGYGLEWEDHKKSFKGNFSEAERYCQNLELDGKSDWRLPTNKELWYLGDRKKSGLAISSTFQNVEETHYWSNQKVTYSGYEDSNWGTRFSDGQNTWEGRNEDHFTKCVRGKSYYEDIEFVRNGDIIEDRTNGLGWSGSSENSMNWSSAKSYCSNLNFGGRSDWRLPTIEELYSITDQRKNSYPYVNGKFKTVKSSWYWSVTKYNKNSSSSWIVDFKDGNDDWVNQTDDNFAVCVLDL